MNIGEAAPFIFIGVVIMVVAFTVWAQRPTQTEIAVYELGFNDGAEGRDPEHFEHPRNQEIYTEGYEDGSRGRTRRADAEKIRRRTGQGK